MPNITAASSWAAGQIADSTRLNLMLYALAQAQATTSSTAGTTGDLRVRTDSTTFQVYMGGAFQTVPHTTASPAANQIIVASTHATPFAIWAGRPCCVVTNSGAFSVAESAVVKHTFDTEIIDTDGIHSTAANTSRLTAVSSGNWHIFASVAYASVSGGYRSVGLIVDNSTIIAYRLADPETLGATYVAVDCIHPLALNSYVEVRLYHTYTTSLNSNANALYEPLFGMIKVG